MNELRNLHPSEAILIEVLREMTRTDESIISPTFEDYASDIRRRLAHLTEDN